MAKQYKCKQSPCSILQPSWIFKWFSLNPVIAKYPNLSKIPMRITQNMRTCAKSRENYAKYANLGKIPWELRKICELTQNPVRITQNMNLRIIPWELPKICEFTQNPVRITSALYTTISLYIELKEGAMNSALYRFSRFFRKIASSALRGSFVNNLRIFRQSFANFSSISRRFGELENLFSRKTSSDFVRYSPDSL